ncbi:hypothetical protein MRB53_024971 [Persea americana]|uniref:Uncharacterized protein n=1 Tax=Persea americana TaxID=3435 RepID=A0ACC2LEX7_PERAE|nr:hypothetical protein MRB53_024971 [Persea americana]
MAGKLRIGALLLVLLFPSSSARLLPAQVSIASGASSLDGWEAKEIKGRLRIVALLLVLLFSSSSARLLPAQVSIASGASSLQGWEAKEIKGNMICYQKKGEIKGDWICYDIKHTALHGPNLGPPLGP